MSAKQSPSQLIGRKLPSAIIMAESASSLLPSFNTSGFHHIRSLLHMRTSFLLFLFSFLFRKFNQPHTTTQPQINIIELEKNISILKINNSVVYRYVPISLLIYKGVLLKSSRSYIHQKAD